MARQELALPLRNRDSAVALLRTARERGMRSMPGYGYYSLQADAAFFSLQSYPPARDVRKPNG